MLATGGSAKCAVKVLIEHGADVSKIIFVNVLACPEGIAAMNAAYPGTVTGYLNNLLLVLYIHIIVELRVLTGSIDDGLNEKVTRF